MYSRSRGSCCWKEIITSACPVICRDISAGRRATQILDSALWRPYWTNHNASGSVVDGPTNLLASSKQSHALRRFCNMRSLGPIVSRSSPRSRKLTRKSRSPKRLIYAASEWASWITVPPYSPKVSTVTVRRCRSKNWRTRLDLPEPLRPITTRIPFLKAYFHHLDAAGAHIPRHHEQRPEQR